MTESLSEGPDLKRTRRQKQPGRVLPDRLPPHSPEAEQGVLGCVLVDPKCLCECVLKFGKNGGEVFYDLRHQTIFKAMADMDERRMAIDVITLQQFLKDKQVLEQVGGIAYLSVLPDVVSSAANLSYYLDIVIEKAMLRHMIHTATEVVGRIYDFEGDVAQLMDETERRVLAVRDFVGKSEYKSVREAVKRVINRIEDLHTKPNQILGLTTGLADLDKQISGLVAGSMIVVAARPSQGKTSLCMNIVEHVCIDLGLPVGVFSLETSIDNLVMRMLCSRSRVNARNIRDGFLAERDFPKLTGAAGKIAASNLFIDDASGLSIMELRARARRMHQQHGIKLLVIDYLQLLIATMNGRRIDKREREVAEISSGIKALGKELGIPILAISQISREVDKSKRKPTMADLRESGALEQDADVIGLLHKTDREEDGYDECEAAVAMDLLIAKNKDGQTGPVKLTFLKSYTRFESAAKVSDEDVPGQESLPYR